MDDGEFRKKVYAPYSDAWKILRIIQHAGQSKKDDELWDKYLRAIDDFCKKHDNSSFREVLVRMLMDAGDSLAKMNGGKDEI